MDLPMGGGLGELTDETLKTYPNGDVHIAEFISVGPKAYGLRYSNGCESIKFKGVPHNKKVSLNLLRE